MVLSDFLVEYREQIVELCREKVSAVSGSKPTSALLDRGLPLFYDELIEVLRRTASNEVLSPSLKTSRDAAAHGKESLRLGYTISQVVHSYGAVCQSLTEFVQKKPFLITPPEFQDFNLALDCAIAEAVTEFEKAQSENVGRNEAERLGFLIHELGASLAAATVSFDMIQGGHVGNSGSTSKILKGSLERMRHILNISLTEIRLRTETFVMKSDIRLVDIVSEVEAIASIMNQSKQVSLEINVDPSIEFTADRHLVYSAISNLVNNAIKFTKEKGCVVIRGREENQRILIEVGDECGGIPDGKVDELFDPFVQKSGDKSGLGLGLSLSRKAIELNHGKMTARDVPGKGCIFTIDLPKS